METKEKKKVFVQHGAAEGDGKRFVSLKIGDGEKILFTMGDEFPENLDDTYLSFDEVAAKNVSIYRKEKVSASDILASLGKSHEFVWIDDKKQLGGMSFVDLYNDALEFRK